MDTLEAIQRLAQQARQEKTPEFNVADRVLQQIEPEDERALGFIVFDVFASVSAVVASVVGYFSVEVLKSITSPLVQFFAPLQEVRLW